jgi:hypothetical protein
MGENTAGQLAMIWFVRDMVKNLVDDADSVQVTGQLREQGLVLEVNVAPEDRGRVIGRGGVTARSLRNLVAAAAGKHRVRCELMLHDGQCVDRGQAALRTNADNQRKDGL